MGRLRELALIRALECRERGAGPAQIAAKADMSGRPCKLRMQEQPCRRPYPTLVSFILHFLFSLSIRVPSCHRPHLFQSSLVPTSVSNLPFSAAPNTSSLPPPPYLSSQVSRARADLIQLRETRILGPSAGSSEIVRLLRPVPRQHNAAGAAASFAPTLAPTATVGARAAPAVGAAAAADSGAAGQVDSSPVHL
jgi:hypothetical protein